MFGKEIFELNPKEFPYVTKNTRWLYTWKMGQTVKAKIKVWNQWIPTTSYLHDKNIMETALKDPYYHGKTGTAWLVLTDVDYTRSASLSAILW